MGPRIVVVGGGSYHWAPRLLCDFANTPALAGADVVLHDLDADRLKLMEELGEPITEPCDYDPRRWNVQGASLVPTHAREVADTLFHVGPTRFGQEYRRALERAANVRLLLHTSALEIEMDPSHRTAVTTSRSQRRRSGSAP